jgi:CheY-like chemotaxis protein
MKIFHFDGIVETRNYASKQLGKTTHPIDYYNENFYELVEFGHSINVSVEDDKLFNPTMNDIILINLHAPYGIVKTKDKPFIHPLQKLKGIELVKLIRLRRKVNHIICYSFYDFSELIRNPENYLLASEGLTYVQLYKSSFPTDIDNIKNSFADLKLVKKYIRANHETIQDNRHNWANWWGVYQMLKIQYVMDGEAELLQNELANLPSYKFATSLDSLTNEFLLDYEEPKEIEKYVTEESIKKAIKQNKQLEVDELDVECECNQDDIDSIKAKLDLSKITIEDLKIAAKINYTDLIGKEKRKEEKKKSEFENQMNLLNKLNNEIKIKRQIKISEIEEIQNSNLDEILSKVNNHATIQSKLSDIKNRDFNILHIEDQPEIGWSNLINKIALKAKYTLCKTKAEVDNLSDFSLYNVLILDLNLQKTPTQRNQLLAGFEIIKYVRSKAPYIPIIITSASNKIWNFKRCVELGADEYWIKPGIDGRYSFNEISNSYDDLISSLHKLLSPNYQVPFTIWNDLIKMDHGTSYHKTMTWSRGTILDRSKLQNVAKFKECLDLWENSIDDYYLYLRYQVKTSLVSIIVNIGSIIEIIHGGVGATTIKNRKDYLAYFFWEIRNGIAHNIGFNHKGDLIQINKLLFAYIDIFFLFFTEDKYSRLIILSPPTTINRRDTIIDRITSFKQFLDDNAIALGFDLVEINGYYKLSLR